MTFDMGKKKKWSLGPAIQLGWKAEVHAKEGCARMITFFEEKESAGEDK